MVPTRTFDAGEDLWRFRGAIGCLSKHGTAWWRIFMVDESSAHIKNSMQISLCIYIYIYIYIQWHIFNRLNVNDEITSESNCHLHLLYNFLISSHFSSIWIFMAIFANLPIFTSFTLLPRSNHQGTLLPRSEAETPPTSAMSPGISSKKKKRCGKNSEFEGMKAWHLGVFTIFSSCRRICEGQTCPRLMYHADGFVFPKQWRCKASNSEPTKVPVRSRERVYEWGKSLCTNETLILVTFRITVEAAPFFVHFSICACHPCTVGPC